MTNDGTFDVGIDTRAAVRAHREAPWTENPVGAVQKGSLSVIYVGLSRNLKEIRPNFLLRGGLNVTFATDSDLAFAVWRRRWLLRLRTLWRNWDRWNRPHYPHRVTSHWAIVDAAASTHCCNVARVRCRIEIGITEPSMLIDGPVRSPRARSPSATRFQATAPGSTISLGSRAMWMNRR